MKQKNVVHIIFPHLSSNLKMDAKFEDLAHEPCHEPCGPIVLKFYKKQTYSEKYKICYANMIL